MGVGQRHSSLQDLIHALARHPRLGLSSAAPPMAASVGATLAPAEALQPPFQDQSLAQ